jgi:hypothetical protein
MPSVSYVSNTSPLYFVPTGKSTTNQSVSNSGNSSKAAQDFSAVLSSQSAQNSLPPSASSASGSGSSTNTISVEAQLAAIKAKDSTTRTSADMTFLLANDPQLAAITAKENQGAPLTSSELDYEQKARGFVNSMAFLSPEEKELYDKAAANGNPQAAGGISVIAFERSTLGHTAGGAPGTTYDPINTPITAYNIVRYFSYTNIDPTGKMQSQFQALIQFLQTNPDKG